MDDAKQQLIDKLKSANNILVTVSRDPSVDQLASCIGLTLLLNKQGKHAAAVFSGRVPSTLEFLQPNNTLEKNTDSLRDFIISLDKAKADKLRYKVEEDVVRIFITPYKTSLSQDDLEFSEGDFNVDVVIALGVQNQDDLDQAITAHGRILHDATVTSLNTSGDSGLGTINWYDPQASSLSELVTDLAQALNPDMLDEQIATALLTGIISETGRFSNDKTSSQTMSASALLLSAGANQQLVASKLEGGGPVQQSLDNSGQDGSDGAAGEDGVLDIDHAASEENAKGSDGAAAPAAPEPPADNSADSAPSEPSPLPPPSSPSPETTEQTASESSQAGLSPGPKMMTEPPKMGGMLTANSEAEHLDPVTDPLSMPESEMPALLDRNDEDAPSSQPPPGPGITPPAPTPPQPPAWTPPPAPQAAPPTDPPAGPAPDDSTLSDIEKSVASPHSATLSELEAVRGEVSRALSGSESTEPIEGLNAQPFGGDLHAPQPTSESDAALPATPPASQISPTVPSEPPAANDGDGTDTPPPVPPPIPFQFGNSPPSS